MSRPEGVRVWRSPKVEVRQSRLGGSGVFASASIAAGEVVAVKVGHVVDTEEMARLTAEVGDFGLQIHENLFLTPRTPSEVESMVVMINHSCDANVGFDGQVTYVAIRAVTEGEELCHDYAMMRTTAYTLNCLCGAVDCRGTVTGDDWQLPAVQAKYGRFFQPHILHRIDAG